MFTAKQIIKTRFLATRARVAAMDALTVMDVTRDNEGFYDAYLVRLACKRARRPQFDAEYQAADSAEFAESWKEEQARPRATPKTTLEEIMFAVAFPD
jgi:hypothetical protein